MNQSEARARELLGKHYDSLCQAAKDMLARSSPQTISEAYVTLRNLKISREKIFRRAELLTRLKGALESNHAALRGLGLSEAKIATHAHLLDYCPESVAENHAALIRAKIRPKKIATLAQLLSLPPGTIECRIAALGKIGISRKRPHRGRSFWPGTRKPS
jgi:hypothetical protein